MRHKCLASFVVFLLYFSISLLIFTAGFRTLVRPETMSRVLSSSNIYENLPKLITSALEQNKEINPQSRAITNDVISSIEPKMLQTEVEKNLPPFMAYLNGRGNLAKVNFDLRTFKSKLQATMEKTDASNEFISQIHDFYNLGELKNPEKTFGRAILSFKILNYTYWGSLIISIILILSLILLGRSYWPAMLRWPGVGLLLPGITLLFFAFVSLFLPKYLLAQMSTGANELNQDTLKMLAPLVESFGQVNKSIFLLYSGIVAGLGFVLILLSYIIPHPPEPKPPVKPAPAPMATPPNPLPHPRGGVE